MALTATYQQTELGNIPVDWGIVELQAICDVRDGTHESPRYLNQGVPFVTSKNIVGGKLDLQDITYISKSDAVRINKRSKVERTDILMSMIGTIGNSVLVDFEPAFCIKNVALIKPRKVEPKYLIQLLNSSVFQAYLTDNLDGGIQKFVSLETLRDLLIPMPPLPEQEAIAEALADVDALLAALDKLIAKKRAIKQAAMQQLLTGKTRLPGFTGEWKKTTLGAIGDCIIGLTYKPENVVEHGLLVLRSSNIRNGRLVYDDNVYVDMTVADHLITRPGDILICVRNGSRDLIGKSAVIDERSANLSFGAFMAIYRTKYWPYVSQVLQGQDIQRQIRENVGATINQITNKDMRAFRLKLPSEREQTAIATVLSDMDDEVTALEKRRDKTQQIKQAMMQQLLTGRIRLINPSMAEAST